MDGRKSGSNAGSTSSGDNYSGQNRPAMYNPATGQYFESSAYTAEPSGMVYPQQQAGYPTTSQRTAPAVPNTAYPSSAQQGYAAGSSSASGSSQVVPPIEIKEDLENLVVNSKGLKRFEPNEHWWERPMIKATLRGSGTMPVFNRIGYLIPENYQVNLNWLAPRDRNASEPGHFMYLQSWLDSGLRLHNFTQYYPRLVCKWLFTLKMDPDGEFMQKWARVFGQVEDRYKGLEQGNKEDIVWYNNNRDGNWELGHPRGLTNILDPFDRAAESRKAREALLCAEEAAKKQEAAKKPTGGKRR
ncbi:hypothetical protein V8F20_011460 [Naviculisporaceae sp. PSN 640]